jgi:aromatic-amino-acid transaminase
LSSTLTSNPFSALIASVRERSGDDPIFSLNAEARRRAAAGESILNATLGALMSDDGRLVVPPTVAKALSRISHERSSAYAPIAGPSAYLEAVMRDTLGQDGLAESATAVATSGGTGAILHAITCFLDSGQSLLTTDYYWAPYRIIASHTRRAVETFPMFDEVGGFDLHGFEAALAAQMARQGRSLVLLNFPCHNPTGYTLDAREWSGLVDIIERHGNRGPITILFDLAYAKFGAPGTERWVDHLERLSGSAQVLIAWSASKAFAQYGARIGSLIALQTDAEERRRIKNALSFACRGTWSNCNHLGMLAVTELLTKPDLAATYQEELRGLVSILNRRVDAFNVAARQAGITYPRYDGGFFVTAFTPDAQRTAEFMRERGVFVVPLEGAVRIALCATPQGEIERLVETLAAGVRAAEAS